MRLSSIIFILILSFTFSTNVAAVDQNAPFYVSISGKRGLLPYMKKRTELKMARSVEFCRGFYMPTPMTTWSCKKSAPKVSSCKIRYKCQLINRNFSRLTETRKITRELNKVSSRSGKFKIQISKNSISSYRKMRLARYKKQGLPDRLKRGSVKNKMKKRLAEARDEIDKFDEFGMKAYKRTSKKKIKTSAEARNFDFAELERQEEKKEKDDEAAYQLDLVTSTDGGERLYKVRKKDGDKYEDSSDPLRLAAFSGAITKVADINDNSVATTEVAWAPRYRFAENWTIRGHLGGHYLKANINEEDETFLVWDVGGVLEYDIWKGLYAELGTGIQKWSSSLGGSFSTMTMGAGWRFNFYQVKIVDRIFASLTSVGNEDKNSEFKMGIGISF